jgi:hypothetical protein
MQLGIGASGQARGVDNRKPTANMSAMNLDGYLIDGRFAADVKKLGYDTMTFDAKLPAADFSDRLPSSARASLSHVVQMLAKRGFPELYAFGISEDSWAFDFAANGVEVLNADFEGDLSGDVFSMATDGGGNHYCLAVDGRVVIWNHEESNIEDHTQFASLEEALWAVLHYEAVKDEKIAYDAIRVAFAEYPADCGVAFLRDELEEL